MSRATGAATALPPASSLDYRGIEDIGGISEPGTAVLMLPGLGALGLRGRQGATRRAQAETLARRVHAG